MRADNTAPIIAAARNRHELTRAKAVRALRQLSRSANPVTFDAVARAAGVSRSWLYSQADIRSEIERLREATRAAHASPVPASQRSSTASLRARLETALDRNRRLAEENRQLRQQLAHALGDQRHGHWAKPAHPSARSLSGNDPAPPAHPDQFTAGTSQTLSTMQARRSEH